MIKNGEMMAQREENDAILSFESRDVLSMELSQKLVSQRKIRTQFSFR